MLNAHPIYSLRQMRKVRASGGKAFELVVPSLDVHAGQIVVLRSESGGGKSTLLDVLAMTMRPDSTERMCFCPPNREPVDLQRLWRDGKVDSLSNLRGRHLGYVLQTGGLLSFLTVRENISLPCRFLGLPEDEAVEALASRLNILDQLPKLPGNLSVGERQRVAIARALVHAPDVVLADEPTASVDPVNADIIFDAFLSLVEEAGSTAIVASHDSARTSTDQCLVLSHRVEKERDTIRSYFWS